MTPVWLVLQVVPYEGEAVKGVYSKRERADAVCAELDAAECNTGDIYADVTHVAEEWVVDVGRVRGQR